MDDKKNAFFKGEDEGGTPEQPREKEEGECDSTLGKYIYLFLNKLMMAIINYSFNSQINRRTRK
jgi:hypothetical protein